MRMRHERINEYGEIVRAEDFTSTPTQTVLAVYRELADHYDRLGQPSMRDRFLMLAADAALSAGGGDVAERLRQRLLSGNRHHMLRPYGSFEEASRAADVQAYLDGLRANYPPDQARDLLDAMGGGV